MPVDPGEQRTFTVDKLRSTTPVRVSLLSTVEAFATVVLKRRLRTLFCCNSWVARHASDNINRLPFKKLSQEKDM